MSSQGGDRGYPSSDTNRPAKQTGLRSRETIPRQNPPASQFAPASGPVGFDGRPPKSVTVSRHLVASSPPMPTPSSRGRRKRAWVNSASKHLRFAKFRDKSSTSQARTMAASTPETPTAVTSQNLSVQPHSFSSRSRPPVPALLNTQHHPSPTDKPLPSLPVASVEPTSPVGRSLIDCAERPLRRSLTPPDSGVAKDEDWPTIEPSKPGMPTPPASRDQNMKPSLGESLLESMRGLKLEEKDDNVQSTPKIRFDIPEPETDTGKESNMRNQEDMSPADAGDSKRPLSSSQLPTPRDSMLQSLSRHVDSPFVRQTKTSALRIRRSLRKKTWTTGEKKLDVESQEMSIRERFKHDSPSLPRSKQLSSVGPIRSTSRGRYGVTGRGSPYTIPSRSNPQRKSEPRDESEISGIALPIPPRNSNNRNDISNPPGQKLRQSSIPLPSRVNRQSETPSELPLVAASMGIKIDNNEEVAEVSGHSLAGNHQLMENAITSASPSASKAQFMNVKEVLSSAAPHDDESILDSGTDNTRTSVRGFDSFGGYRVKRVRNAPKMGPTIRITDSASRILLGDNNESKILTAPDINISLRKKSSAPEIGSPQPEKEVRRSSTIFTRPLSFARSFTDRSPSHFKTADDDESRKLIEGNTRTDTVQRAVLPGGEVNPNLNAVKATLRNSTETNGIPTSNHGDWPGKDFDSFESSESTPITLQENTANVQTSGESIRRPMAMSRPSIESRPAIIVQRTAPCKETAPFLFQDLEEPQGLDEETKRSTIFPPRTSSRKPPPPPIVVSAPDHPPSVHFQATQAPKAYGINPDMIAKPRNVKTFSQSLSPHTDSGKGRKVSYILAHAPSSSSKKVISNIRGLFHKRSTESARDVNADVDEMGSDVKAASKLGLQASVRRNPVSDNKMANPLRMNPHASDRPSTSPPPFIEAKGPRAAHKHHNPFNSPTTPFTATIKTSPSAYPAANMPAIMAATASLDRLASAPKPTSPTNDLSTGTPTLSHATSLTHRLLDLARAEPNPGRKVHLIELSKCMVEVVSAAREAEKVMEKAKMEAARAEVSYLKVCKKVGKVDLVVKELVGDEFNNAIDGDM